MARVITPYEARRRALGVLGRVATVVERVELSRRGGVRDERREGVEFLIDNGGGSVRRGRTEGARGAPVVGRAVEVERRMEAELTCAMAELRGREARNPRTDVEEEPRR